MVCKFCGASMEDGQSICPLCGQDQTGTQPVSEGISADETANPPADVTPEETPGASDAAAETADAASTADDMEDASPAEAAADPEPGAEEAAGEAPEGDGNPKPAKPKRASLWLLGALAVAAIAAVALLVVSLVRPDGVKLPKDTLEFTYADKEGNFVAHDFTKPAGELSDKQASQVIATCGGKELTNKILSYYYWQTYSSYGSYLSYILDPALPLSEQMYDETHTWQDFFLQASMAAFQQNAALGTTAEAEGFELSDLYTSFLESLSADLASTAEAGGFESGDAYLQSLYGPYADVDSFLDYVRLTFLASEYLNSQLQTITYEPDEVSAYYDENAAGYEANGVTKDDTNMINVRHILIVPAADEGAETDENGNVVLTDENWADAEAQARDILAQWEAGEATEESFAALAQEHSADGGSASNGGLYENVYPGRMVAEFNDWCFDAARQPGDTAIVRTQFGYHIMYFSATADQPYWYVTAEQDYVSTLQRARMDELVNAQPFTVDYNKVVLMDPVQTGSEEDSETAADSSDAESTPPETDDIPAESGD